ncbi:MAG: aldo/keto reductase [Actinobacteria bacterium]|nr:MAG: aldo/keto reductase [Actinomycetota bacterium]
MRYKLLGPSGLRVSELALGTMTFGEDWGWGAPKEESRRIFDRFVEGGGNFIDTANNYTNGTSERFLGEFVAGDRDHFVVATKYTLTERTDDPNFGGNHRKNMVRSVEGSLQRLATDRIDLLWLHMWDGTTPVEEVLRGMDDLVRAGKVLSVGFSDTPAWVVSQAVAIARLRGWTAPVAVQAPYHLGARSVERDVLPMATSLGLCVTPWAVTGQGSLTGKYNGPATEPRRWDVEGDTVSPSRLQLAEVVMSVAEEAGRSPAQVAINWVRQQPGTIVPILGARTELQIKDNLGCLDFELSSDQLARLSEASPIDLDFPRSFLESGGVRELIFGQTYDLIEQR